MLTQNIAAKAGNFAEAAVSFVNAAASRRCRTPDAPDAKDLIPNHPLLKIGI